MEPRGLSELEIRAKYVLDLPHEDRSAFIEIARTKSPSSAYDLALQTAIIDYHQMVAITIAKATRWLAMIRRDFGEDKFNEVVER